MRQPQAQYSSSPGLKTPLKGKRGKGLRKCGETKDKRKAPRGQSKSKKKKNSTKKSIKNTRCGAGGVSLSSSRGQTNGAAKTRPIYGRKKKHESALTKFQTSKKDIVLRGSLTNLRGE